MSRVLAAVTVFAILTAQAPAYAEPVAVKKLEMKKVVEIKKAAAPAAPAVVAPTSQPAAASQPTPTKLSTNPPAVTPPVDPGDIMGMVKMLIQSGKGHQWALFAGLLIMILTWFVDRILKNRIPRKVVPWLSVGLSMGSTIAFTLAAGAGWLNAVVAGVHIGLVAIGGWEALGKHIPGAKAKPKDAGGQP